MPFGRWFLSRTVPIFRVVVKTSRTCGSSDARLASRVIIFTRAWVSARSASGMVAMIGGVVMLMCSSLCAGGWG